MGETDRLAGRNGDIWRLYCRGMTQEAIARKYEIKQATVSEIIKGVRDNLPRHVREEAVQEVREHLRELRAEATRIADMEAPPVTVGQRGEILIDPVTKEVVRDYSGKLRAMETALRFAESERKLLGLDAAVKVEQVITDQSAADKAAAEAAKRLEALELDEGTEGS